MPSPRKPQTQRQQDYEKVDGPSLIQSPDSASPGFKKLQTLGTYADQNFSVDEVEAALPKDPQQRQAVLAAAASINNNNLMWLAIDLWGAFEITHPNYKSPSPQLYSKAGPLLKKTILALANLDETGENELNPAVESQAASLVKQAVDNARNNVKEAFEENAPLSVPQTAVEIPFEEFRQNYAEEWAALVEEWAEASRIGANQAAQSIINGDLTSARRRRKPTTGSRAGRAWAIPRSSSRSRSC